MLIKEIVAGAESSRITWLEQFLAFPDSGPAGVASWDIFTVNCGIGDLLTSGQEERRDRYAWTLTNQAYHLVASFNASDIKLTLADIREIEQRIGERMGYGNHPRLAAMHWDPEHSHLHMAMNQVHPETGQRYIPGHSHHRLESVAKVLEKDFKLVVDRHATSKVVFPRPETKKLNPEVPRLMDWVERECREVMGDAVSWEDMYIRLAEKGLEIRAHNTKLFLLDREGNIGLTARIAAELARPLLEKRLGPFRPAQMPRQTLAKRIPLMHKNEEKILFRDYRRAVAQGKKNLRRELARLRTKRDTALKRARQEYDMVVHRAKTDPSIRARLCLQRDAGNAYREKVKLIRDRMRKAASDLKTSATLSLPNWLHARIRSGKGDAVRFLKKSSTERQLLGEAPRANLAGQDKKGN